LAPPDRLSDASLPIGISASRFRTSKLADPNDLPDQRIQEIAMIRPLPSNIGFQYRLVPVFTWQKISTTEHNPIASSTTQAGATQAAPSSGQSSDQSIQTSAPVNATTTEQAADMRLVFSGYRWRAVAHFEQTPNRGYERFTETDPSDSAERARTQAVERQQVQAAQQDAAIERQVSIGHLSDKPAREK